MVIYDSAGIYINESADLHGRVVRIDQVIDALLTTAADSAASGTGNYKEYSLDDGQTKIRTVYSTIADIYASINALEKLKQLYLNRINGRVFRLVDGKNFN